MVLAWVRPAAAGFDLRTFDCMTCARTERVTLQTVSERWRSSPPAGPELRLTSVEESTACSTHEIRVRSARLAVLP
jgi:hypothetical protein